MNGSRGERKVVFAEVTLRKAAELVKQFNIVGTVLNKSSEKPKRNAGYYYYGTANEAYRKVD